MAKIKGLGDVIKKITNAIGIETCEGCEQRRVLLNDLVPFTKEKILTDSEIEIILRNKESLRITAEDIRSLYSIYNRVFKVRLETCYHCPTTIIKIKDDLWNVYTDQSKNSI